MRDSKKNSKKTEEEEGTPSVSNTDSSGNRSEQGRLPDKSFTDSQQAGRTPNGDEANPDYQESKTEQATPALREGYAGFNYHTAPGNLRLPAKTYLFFEEQDEDRDLVVAVPARVQTWLVSQTFISGVAHLIPEFDERVNGLTYNFSDQLMLDAQKRGNLSREVLLNIIRYLSKFREFIGISALTKLEDASSRVPDTSSYFKNENDILLADFKKYLRLGTNSKDLIDLLEKSFKNDEVNAILEMAISNVDRYLIRGVLSPAVMRFALEDQITAVADWETLIATLTLPNAEAAVRDLQDLYSYAASSRVLDALGNKIVDIAGGSTSISSLIQITDMFSRFDGPVVHLKIDNVIDASLRAAGFETPQTSSPAGQFVYRKLTSIPKEFELQCTRLHVMHFYLALLDFYTKRSPSVSESWQRRTSAESDLKILTLTSRDADRKNLHGAFNSFLPGSIKAIPYIETHPDFSTYYALDDAGVFSQLSDLFQRVFVRRIFVMATSGDYGIFMNRVRSLIDERALERSDTWDYVVDSSLRASSIYYQAFVDTVAFFKHLALMREIHYLCDTEELVNFLDPLFSASFEHDQVAILSSDHPASIYEGANITQSFVTYLPGDVVLDKVKPWLLRDSVHQKTNAAQIYDPVSDTYKNFFQGNIKGGTWYDLPTAFPRGVHYYNIARPLEVGRLIPYELSSSLLTDTDVGRFLFEHPLMSGLLKTGYGDSFMRNGLVEFERFFSPDDVAIRFQIPEPLALQLWNSGLTSVGDGMRIILTYTGPRTRYLEIPEDMFPFLVYEREPRFGSTVMIIDYPYQADRTYTGWLGRLPDFSVSGSDPHKSGDRALGAKSIYDDLNDSGDGKL